MSVPIKFRRRNGIEKDLDPTYRFPGSPHISRSVPGADALYRDEERLGDLMRRIAGRLGDILRLEDFWREQLPEALLSLLERYEDDVGVVVSLAYLQARGFTVLDAHGIECGVIEALESEDVDGAS